MSTIYCIDANVLIYALLPFPQSLHAEALLKQIQEENASIVVPTLFQFEVPSVIHRLHFLREITKDEEETAFQQFNAFPAVSIFDDALLAAARQIAQRFSQPRIYDSAYLAVAQRYQRPLWTGDQKLVNAVSKQIPWVNWIGAIPLDAPMRGTEQTDADHQ